MPLLPTLDNGFVYDDQVLLGEVWPSWTDALTEDLFGRDEAGRPASGFYRPLVRLSYRAEAALFGASARGYHADNLLLAAAVALLLLACLKRVPALAPVALPAVVLFAAHPVHAESLALITGRTDPLATACFLGAFLLAARGRDALALAAFALALCAKESAAVLAPVLAAAPLITRTPPGERERRRRALVLCSGAVLLVAAFFAVKIGALGIVPPADAYRGEGSALERGLTFLAAIPKYCGLLLWPAHLSIVHDHELARSALDPRALGGAAIVAALVLLAVRGGAPARAGAALFLWTLAPASNLVPITYSFRAMPFPLFERYLFVPSIGAALIAASALAWVLGRRERVLAFAVLLAVPLAMRGARRALDFRADSVLFEAAAAHFSRPADLWVQAGFAHHREQRPEQALAAFERALAANPDQPEALVGAATTRLDVAQHLAEVAAASAASGREDEARQLRERSAAELAAARAALSRHLERRPQDGRAVEVLAVALALAGDARAAGAEFLRALDLPGTTPALAQNFRRLAEQMAHEAKALAFDKGQPLEAALYAYERALRACTGAFPPVRIPEPIRDVALRMLCEHADTLFQLGRPGADGEYLLALRFEPTLFRCYEGLGEIAKQAGRRAEAYRHFEQALALDPDAFFALSELFTMSQEDGRTEDAAAYYARYRDVLQRKSVRPGAEKPQ